MIPFVCPHCEHRMELPDEFAGQRATCTRCGIPFATPEASVEESGDAIWAEVYGERSAAGHDADEVADRPARRAQPAGEAGEYPDWIEARQRKVEQRLGPPFWGAAYFLPPAAFIWALFLPRRHPQKKVAIVMPLVWMMVIGGVAFAGVYLTPEFAAAFGGESPPPAQTAVRPTTPQVQQGAVAPGRRARPGEPGWIDVMRLNPGEMYRVTGSPVNVHYRARGGEGTFGNLALYQIPPGGIFQITRVTKVEGRTWYEAIVTDGSQNYLMWIDFRSLRRAGLEPVPPPSFTDPNAPISAPIRRVY